MWLDGLWKRDPRKGDERVASSPCSTAARQLFEQVASLAEALHESDRASTGDEVMHLRASALERVPQIDAQMHAADPLVLVELMRLAVGAWTQTVAQRDTWRIGNGSYTSEAPGYWLNRLCYGLITTLLAKNIPWTRDDVEMLVRASHLQQWGAGRLQIHKPLLKAMHRLGFLGDAELRAWVRQVVDAEEAADKPDRKWTKFARELLGEPPVLALAGGEVWCDALAADLDAMAEAQRDAWFALLMHASTSSGASPAQKWSGTAAKLAASVGRDEIVRRLTRWLALVDAPRESAIDLGPYQKIPAGSIALTDVGQELLKGLCWCAAELGDPRLARVLGHVALSAYRKIPGVGPRAARVGNAAIFALSRTSGTDAIGQLAMLRVKLKVRTADKVLERALHAAAERAGVAREELDELGVPSYGFTQIGARHETLGEFSAELAIDVAGTTKLSFVRPDGRVVKSVPAAVKAKHAEALADMKAAAKDAAAMMSAQRERIDALFVDEKSWPLATWRERYLDHPLIGVIARSLVWSVVEAEGRKFAVFFDATRGFVGADGELVDIVEQGASVRLWHPIESHVDDVVAWRRFFEDRGIRQPFKQAHREIYPLTEAERATGTYSNRFAAHVLRQHQFNALCATRGWRNKLRLLVDDEYPPAMRSIARHGLRAEFWIEGAGNEYGRDTTESGTFLYLMTDQVRFYAATAAENRAHAGGGGYAIARAMRASANEPLPLDRIPPLVLSEVMRDIDLFVGVASVGANPQWQDGGPESRYREYWWAFGFGELSENGAGRRELLQRLIPRLSIASRCSFTERFLVVEGKLRTYKIHLGSGNILMQPSDEYLCIVPDSSQLASSAGAIHLPFEGDRTLSIILSKALLLAADDEIVDRTIVQQIRA